MAVVDPGPDRTRHGPRHARRPDPKEIGIHLSRYYSRLHAPAQPRRAALDFSARRLLRQIPTRLAIVSNCAAQANMSIVMVLTSLVLAHHVGGDRVLPCISLDRNVCVHDPARQTGRPRLRSRTVMIPGVASGSSAQASSPLRRHISPSRWGHSSWGSAGLRPMSRRRLFHRRSCRDGGTWACHAASMTVSAAQSSVFAAVVTGPLIAWQGLPASGVMAILIAIAPLAMLPAAQAERRLAHLELPLTANPGRRS